MRGGSEDVELLRGKPGSGRCFPNCLKSEHTKASNPDASRKHEAHKSTSLVQEKPRCGFSCKHVKHMKVAFAAKSTDHCHQSLQMQRSTEEVCGTLHPGSRMLSYNLGYKSKYGICCRHIQLQMRVPAGGQRPPGKRCCQSRACCC